MPPTIETSSTKFVKANIEITSPTRKAVGRKFSVRGKASVLTETTEFTKVGGQGKKTVTQGFVSKGFKVTVRVGKKKEDEHEAHVEVENGILHWSHDVVENKTGKKLSITAKLTGTVEEVTTTFKDGEVTSHQTKTIPVNRTEVISVVVDTDKPTLEPTNLKPHPTEPDTKEPPVEKGPPYVVRVEGTAGDKTTRVEAVEMKIGGTVRLAENLSGDWSRWRAVGELPDRDSSHTITVRAIDSAGNDVKVDLPISPDVAPPDVAILKPPTNPHLPLFQEGGITVPVEGMADDIHSKIRTVRWRLDGGPEEEAENVTGDWIRWRLEAEIDDPDEHIVAISATDMTGKTSGPVELKVQPTIES